MEFFKSVVDLLSTVVTAIGGVYAVSGGIKYFEAHSANDGAAKSAALPHIVAGGGIALIGATLIPQIASIF